MPPDQGHPAEPWRSFLRDLDERLNGVVELQCLGGFVVTQHFGIGRATSDIDFLTMFAQSPQDDPEALAGLGSELHRKYKLYVQRVGVATLPSGYASRLTRMFPAASLKRLKLFALDPTDLALSKLERNAERDREDVLSLVRAGYISRDLLKQRYHEELRPHLLSKQTWHDKTLELWLEMGWPSESS
jgi:hypothetical protein